MLNKIITHKRKREDNFDEEKEKNEENNGAKTKSNKIKTSEENTLSNSNCIDINDINNYTMDFQTNPINIHFFKNIIKGVNSKNNINDDGDSNALIVFKTIYDTINLVYSNKDKYSIICYNLEDNRKIVEIKNAHKYNITEFKHCLEEKNKRDLLISISAWAYNIKLWNANTFECLYHFIENETIDYSPFENDSFTYCSCFLKEKDDIYIIIGRENIYYDENKHPIQVFDIKGNLIKNINNSGEGSDFVSSYYDKKTSTNFIISAYKPNYYCDYIKSFSFKENKLYHQYTESKENDEDEEIEEEKEEPWKEFIIFEKEEKVELLDYSFKEKVIRIWDFHLATILKKINVIKNITKILRWNKQYFFIKFGDIFIIWDIENELICRKIEIFGGKNMNKLILPIYGECLISQGLNYEDIILWINN